VQLQILTLCRQTHTVCDPAARGAHTMVVLPPPEALEVGA
jgi:hypothetical protein